MSRWAIEKHHYLQLPVAARHLLVSAAVYEFAYPLLYTFVNAFIFRLTQDFTAVALYNLGMFVTLPLAFWFNGYVLKVVKIQLVFAAGLLIQGLVVLPLFFLSLSSLESLIIFGAFQGFALGLYWANRNFITLEVTADHNRNYFAGLETLISIVAGIVTPFFLGLIIRAGEYTGTYQAEWAYQSLGVLSLGLLLYGGWVFFTAPVKNPQFKKLLIMNATRQWNWARLQEVSHGFDTGVSFFLPALITFTLIGQEGSLGLLQSTAALLSAGLMYIVARKARPHHRLWLIIVACATSAGISLLFLSLFDVVSAVVYLLLFKFTAHLMWTSANPITLKVIDEAEAGDSTNNYAYVCDRELFLNIGRMIGIACFLGLMYLYSSEAALRFIPILIAASQLGMWWTATQLVRTSSTAN